jgi:hypothetical protein
VNTAYVAGRFGDWQTIRRVQTFLRDRGYSITYDWTVHAEPKDARDQEWKGALPVDVQRTAALTDLAAAGDADLLVLVCEQDMAGALGCYVEFGAAAVAGRVIHVIAPPRGSIFWHLPTVETFCSIEAWMAVFGLREAA